MSLFARGGYSGTIIWQADVTADQRQEIAKAIERELMNKYSFVSIADPYDHIAFGYASPPTSNHIPLDVQDDWNRLFHPYAGQASAGDLSVMGYTHLNALIAPQGRAISNGTHDAGKAEARKVMAETLRGLDGVDTEL